MKKWQGAIILGFMAGFLTFAALRFISYQPEHVHYHANFAVYINGQREQFSEDRFYEDVSACKDHTDMSARDRVHMHNHENSVVHVHDSGVTWGQFFENLGYSLGATQISRPSETFVVSGAQQLNFVLNGQRVSDIANRQIQSEDKLLIDYGAFDESKLNLEYATIESSATEKNHSPDPGSCGSQDSSGWAERWRHIWQ
jgi:hypothetical protein